MKNIGKKLNLRVETLRSLTALHLRGARGGLPRLSNNVTGCCTEPTSGGPGACQSAFVSDCGRC